jgi:hypothetical protein
MSCILCYCIARVAGASPRYSGTPSALTPKASLAPLAAPVLMADKEAIACKLMHAFPWNPTAQVGAALRHTSVRNS